MTEGLTVLHHIRQARQEVSVDSSKLVDVCVEQEMISSTFDASSDPKCEKGDRLVVLNAANPAMATEAQVCKGQFGVIGRIWPLLGLSAVLFMLHHETNSNQTPGVSIVVFP